MQHMIMADKLNSMRLLDRHRIPYTVRAFPDTIDSADGVADHFGIPRDMVYKTLVVQSAQGKPFLVMVAGSRELDLKKVARALGQKKVQMASHNDAEKWTGLQTGGISALALLHKNFPVYIDHLALDLARILVSAGKRGVNLELSVPDLLKITKAKAIEAS
jgi:Cys-tRNA(Pro)/Cys-tRNA(Cys) deacylase